MKKSRFEESFAYIAVACLSAASDWSVFTLLSWTMPGLDVVFAQTPARITGGLVAFLLHRHWSFGSQQGHGLKIEAWRFMALYVFSFCLSVATVFALVDLVGLNRYWSKAVADVLCFCVNFAVMKFYVFSGGQPAGDTNENLLQAKRA